MQANNLQSPYQQTLDYLFSRLPMFSRIGAAAIKKDLTNTLALCAATGDPQDKFKTIHVAGTNGKGSTSHMLAAIFQAAGYKTGLYTSPHLVDFRERIRINGLPVNEAFVVDFVHQFRDAIENIEPSFFEITVAMAFKAFADAEVDIAIIETGLGGRLDSTNVITPELSIITNISLDHTDMLGDTIGAIAKEKAGIIKRGIPVVIGEYHESSFPVFESTASEKAAPLSKAWEHWQVSQLNRIVNGRQQFEAKRSNTNSAISIDTDLGGSYQEHNIATVLTAVDVLSTKGWKVSANAAAGALTDVKQQTGLRGRWDIIQSSPLIVADVAHNPAGIALVMENWECVEANRKLIVVGFVKDKDVRTALSQFPKEATYHFCAADIPRALPAIELAAIGAELGLNGRTYSSVADAVLHARASLTPHDALLITGSFFIVGEALEAIDKSTHLQPTT